MTAPYENAEFIDLGTIMPPEQFRTVLPEDRDAPGGTYRAEGDNRVPPQLADILAVTALLQRSNVRIRLFTQRKGTQSLDRRKVRRDKRQAEGFSSRMGR